MTTDARSATVKIAEAGCEKDYTKGFNPDVKPPRAGLAYGYA